MLNLHRFWHCALLLGCWLVLVGPARAIPQIVHLEQEDFVALAFSGEQPTRSLLYLKGDLPGQLAQILGHEYHGRRIRYWYTADTTAWVFDEIGKEMPITLGVAVRNGQISLLKILVYREERGGEVHQPFFTRQFLQARLDEQLRLTNLIDGITGATLSVQAVTRIARLALFLDNQVKHP